MTCVGLRIASCVVLACSLGALACEREIVRPGQLIVAIDTDMALPQQVDTLHVEVEVNGTLAHQNTYDVGPKKAMLPATLTLVARGDGDDPATIRIAGSKLGEQGLEWRTYREATTSVPRDRIATLRMPVQWL